MLVIESFLLLFFFICVLDKLYVVVGVDIICFICFIDVGGVYNNFFLFCFCLSVCMCCFCCFLVSCRVFLY